MDVAIGNKGQRGYNVVQAAVCTFVYTYFSPLYWLLTICLGCATNGGCGGGGGGSGGKNDSNSSVVSGGVTDELKDTKRQTKTNTEQSQALESPSTSVFLPLLTCLLLSFSFYLCVMFLMRFHLFVWSVFAPKLLYACVGLSLIISFSLACVPF